MTDSFDVRYKGRTVGNVQLSREGAYYRYHAKCALGDKGVYRLIVMSGEDTTPLHIFVPQDTVMICSGRIPAKVLKGENLLFSVVAENKKENSLPVEADKAFAYLDKLEDAVLIMTQNGPEIGFLCDQESTDRLPRE